jgi:hypothetical protein
LNDDPSKKRKRNDRRIDSIDMKMVGRVRVRVFTRIFSSFIVIEGSLLEGIKCKQKYQK